MDQLRQYWHPVIASAEVRDKPVPVTLLHERLVLFRHPGGVSALQDLCIHRGAPLSLGWVDGETLTCAYHGWQYDREGACVRIPSLMPDHPIPRKARATSYRVQERYGLVWVSLVEQSLFPVPEYPAYDDESMTTVLYRPFAWKANAARICENVLDFTHLPWVHDGMLGSRDHPVYPSVEAQTLEDGITYSMPDEGDDTVRHYRVFAPFTVALDVRANSADGHNYSMLFTCLPITSRDTVQWFFTSRDWSLHQPDHVWEKFDEIVMEQDRRIVENQRPEELPPDLTEELHLRGSDAGTLAYRRYLRGIGLEWDR